MKNLILLACLLVTRAALAAPDLAARCAEPELQKLDVAQLRLLRNEIYARHGRVFRDQGLRETFQATDWYKPDPAYSDARLTAADRRCLALIKKVEAGAEQRRRQDLTALHLEDVRNIDQFPSLGPPILTALSRNGFVVVPARHEQLFHVYEENDYLNVPNFITPDPTLQLYHLFFDMTLRNVESERLSGRLRHMVATLRKAQERVVSETRVPSVRAAAERNVAFLAVAAELLKEKGAAPAAHKDAIDHELALIKAHQGWDKSPLLNVPVDYSQFIPRGHYTRSERLKQYFLAMMWLGQVPFVVERGDLTLQILLLCQSLRTTDAHQDWQAIYDVTAFYVGVADDLVPSTVNEVADAIFGAKATPDAFADAGKQTQASAALTKRFKPRIVPVTPFGPIGPNVRVLGQRYIPDSEMLQRLSDPRMRPFPKGLDVMAVLGSQHARHLLLDRLKENATWPKFSEVLAGLTTEFARWDENAWQSNMYTGWLWVLQGLLDVAPQPKLPAFMQSEAWASKNLATTLASWAELRHDTILYAKPSGAECGGGDEPPPPPEGYVEPQVVFYSRLLRLLELSRAGLVRYDVMPESVSGPFKDMVELCAFLKRISEKELAGQRPSRAELEELKIFGANIERLSLAFIDPKAGYWNEITSPADRHMAVIADVHSAMGEALEEAVGPGYEILVLVPKSTGGRQLTRGSVFSYFEFRHPQNDRLTDEAWQKMLEKGAAPAPPNWTDEFMVPNPAPKPKASAAAYSSGC